MGRPNILFILADDLGWGDLGCHDAPIRTPVIDRLAAEGVELTRHYVCPMCTPTRASLLTGRHPGRFGAHATVPSNAPVLPDGYRTLAVCLREAGYDTGLFGKWHLGSSPQFGPNHFGFDTAYGSLAGGVDPYNHRYKRGEHSVTWHRDGILVNERGHVTDLITDAAVRWLEERQRPWFCYVPFTAVHLPVKPTQSWLAAYAGERFDRDPRRDDSFRRYAAYTSHMDHAVGRLLETVECLGQRENTLVVFTSDNGAINDAPLHKSDQYPGWQEACPRLGSNAPFRGVKAQLYEGGIRVPAMVSWRGTLAARREDRPLQVTDWMPTLLPLAGATPGGEACFDGHDAWPLLAGTAAADPERCFYWNFRGGREQAVCRGGWKLIVSRREGTVREELFNVVDDPGEHDEVAGDHPGLVAELRGLLAGEQRLDGTAVRPDAPRG